MTAITDFATGHSKELWGLGAVVFGFLLNRIARIRPRLRYSIGHSSSFLVPEPRFDAEGKQISDRQLVNTAHITVSNTGLQAAKNVEATFNWKPQILNVWPARRFETADSAFDRHSVIFESLSPNETVNIEVMSINNQIPHLTIVRGDECVGKEIKMGMQRLYPSWFSLSAFVLMLIGLATAAYMIISVIDRFLR